jgi:trans-aconitate 2-methyltransferase
MQNWNAEQYLKFADERSRPSLDLIARVADPDPERIIDIGCGPGNSTAILRRRWPDADITGLDNSEDMIAAAGKSQPEGKWILADATAWTAEVPFDLLFSNAALQWMPDHDRLLPHLFSQVGSAGAMAVQIPAHFNSALHREIHEVAGDPLWRDRMDAPMNSMTKKSPEFYYNLLQPLAERLEMWETEYYHVMDDHRAMVEWFRGTGLRPYLAALENDAERQRFEDMLLERYTNVYPRQDDGRILFRFRRLFIIAYQP